MQRLACVVVVSIVPHLLGVAVALGQARGSTLSRAIEDARAAVIATVRELSAACRGWQGECAILERPELEPDRAVRGEVAGFEHDRVARAP